MYLFTLEFLLILGAIIALYFFIHLYFTCKFIDKMIDWEVDVNIEMNLKTGFDMYKNGESIFDSNKIDYIYKHHYKYLPIKSILKGPLKNIFLEWYEKNK